MNIPNAKKDAKKHLLKPTIDVPPDTSCPPCPKNVPAYGKHYIIYTRQAAILTKNFIHTPYYIWEGKFLNTLFSNIFQ